MIDILCAVFSIVVLCVAMAARPPTAACPPGWYVNGARPDGRFACLRPSLGLEDDGEVPPGELTGRVYCTGGSIAIVVNHRTVGCQR